MNRTPSLFAGVEPLEVFAELLADLDADTGGGEFYGRICEAICRLTTMQRAAIFMAESKGQRVRAVGSHGTRLTDLTALNPTLAETPIAQEALKTDAVVVVSGRIEEAVPAEYAAQLGITTLVCTPMSAAGRGYGVIVADRGGGRFELSDGERHLLWTLGKLAGLVATARISTRQEERSRRLADRLSLAREIHERVLQRLFGVSLALGAEPGQDDAGQRQRCRDELQAAITDLRRALERPLAPTPEETGTTLAEALDRLSAEASGRLQVVWQDGLTIPPELETAAQSFLAEALRNVTKHAEATFIGVEVSADEDTISLLVRNDGVRPGGRGAGMGLRLAAFEAIQQGGTVEFGDQPDGEWRARLVLPLGPADG
ncbi:MAG TPA: GAF domain-containing protein [Solirubrobacteraceae bacterium]|nr:GAF domain-containing protein [Solirubrobacteraceae bacterium]